METPGISKQSFIPLATAEDSYFADEPPPPPPPPKSSNPQSHVQVPTYSPTGPGSTASYFSVETGVPYDGGDAVNLRQGRSNHLFCGFCCDSRRAVLSVSAILIAIKLFSMIAVAVAAKFVEENADTIEQQLADDDATIKSIDGFLKGGGLEVLEAVLEIFGFVSIGLHLCGVYGAIKFKRWGVIVGAVPLGLGCVIGLFSLDFFTLIIDGLFLYPHIVFLKEMNEGIMTDYNYHRVASCCGDRTL